MQWVEILVFWTEYVIGLDRLDLCHCNQTVFVVYLSLLIHGLYETSNVLLVAFIVPAVVIVSPNGWQESKLSCEPTQT